MYYKFKYEHQNNWENKQFYDVSLLNNIGKNVTLHGETLTNPKSSSACCINVLGSLSQCPEELKSYLNQFDLNIETVLPFPSGLNLAGEMYDDSGYVIFEWIGPGESAINEIGGSRGKERTSIDAFVLAKIGGKVTQILIEWKFTETYLKPEYFQRFNGIKGNERLRRYSSVLAELRKQKAFPLNMDLEDNWGITDLSYEPFYQLLRMQLLAQKTTPTKIKDYVVEDYRTLHLTHSQNTQLNTIPDEVFVLCPGLRRFNEVNLHKIWKNGVLVNESASKFKFGYWNEKLNAITIEPLSRYLSERYE
jgi:hypothetical protein